jgi:hypothetical protein
MQASSDGAHAPYFMRASRPSPMRREKKQAALLLDQYLAKINRSSSACQAL